jgi:hypothetical protein
MRTLQRVRSDFFEEIGLNHPSDGFPIAKDDKLPGVLDHRKSPSLHLGQKGVAPHKSLNIPQLAADDTAFPRGLRRKQM